MGKGADARKLPGRGQTALFMRPKRAAESLLRLLMREARLLGGGGLGGERLLRRGGTLQGLVLVAAGPGEIGAQRAQLRRGARQPRQQQFTGRSAAVSRGSLPFDAKAVSVAARVSRMSKKTIGCSSQLATSTVASRLMSMPFGPPSWGLLWPRRNDSPSITCSEISGWCGPRQSPSGVP